MHYWDVPEQAEALAAKAIDLLRAHKVAPTPGNYELFFNYAIGQSSDLVAAVDQALTDGTVARTDVTRDLYDRFLKGQRKDAIEQLGSKLQDEVANLADLLQSAGQGTASYGKTLNTVATELKRGDANLDIKGVVEGLVVATRAMEARNKALEHQLDDSAGEVSKLRTQMEAIRQEALIDPLTKIANRRCFDDRMAQAGTEAQKEGTPMCVLMGDVDHFKKFNDTFGHATGDQVLRLVAHCFTSNIKGRDTAARYGGEEFVVIMPSTNLENAAKVAEQIRHDVSTRKIVRRSTGETLGSITLSIGVAQFIPGEPLADVVARADQALYAAKHKGRNRVLTERDLPAAAPARPTKAASL